MGWYEEQMTKERHEEGLAHEKEVERIEQQQWENQKLRRAQEHDLYLMEIRNDKSRYIFDKSPEERTFDKDSLLKKTLTRLNKYIVTYIVFHIHYCHVYYVNPHNLEI